MNIFHHHINRHDIEQIGLFTCMYIYIYVYHYCDVIMGTIASQITSLTIVYSTVYSGADQRKHQSSTSLAFVWGIHRGPHKWPTNQKMFPFDDVIMYNIFANCIAWPLLWYMAFPTCCFHWLLCGKGCCWKLSPWQPSKPVVLIKLSVWWYLHWSDG